MNNTISFKSFIKKITSIPSSFIDDFFNIINTDNISQYNCTIDFNKVIKWLNITLSKGKTTLIKSYVKNIDYKIIKIPSLKGSGGYKKNKILITPHAFKLFCMSTKSLRGNDVRKYYIAVEEALYKYKDYIIKAHENRIHKLEQGLKPNIYPTRGVIYVFKTSDSSDTKPLYKIGRTKKLKQRLLAHQSALSNNIEILYYFESDNIKAVEECLKALLKDYIYKKHKEIYNCDIDIIKQLINNCSHIKDVLNDRVKKSKLLKMKKRGVYIGFIKK